MKNEPMIKLDNKTDESNKQQQTNVFSNFEDIKIKKSELKNFKATDNNKNSFKIVNSDIYCHKIKKNIDPNTIFVGKSLFKNVPYKILVHCKTESNSDFVFIGSYKICSCCNPLVDGTSKLAVNNFLFNTLPNPDKLKLVGIHELVKEGLPRLTKVLIEVIDDQTDQIRLLPFIRIALRNNILYKGMQVNINSVAVNFIIKIVDLKTKEVKSKNQKIDLDPKLHKLYGFFSSEDNVQLNFKKKNFDQNLTLKTVKNSFDDIGGMEQIKFMLEKLIFRFFQYPEFYLDETGKQKNLRLCKGIILHGVPGSGKSFIVSKIESYLKNLERKSENNVFSYPPNILHLNPASITCAKDILVLFERCRRTFEIEKKLTLILIDEMDVLCPRRDSDNNNVLYTNTFLSCLDGPNSHPSTIIIGTTNRITEIDEAVRRPGRIDREIEIPVPNASEKADIFRKILLSFGFNYSWMEDFNILNDIVLNCSGFVPSDLQLVIKRAIEQLIWDPNVDSSDINLTPELLKKTCKTISPSALKEFNIEISKVSWDSIGGYENEKQLLREAVVWPINYKHLFDKYQVKASKGILLYGPPGNSKTLMAKAIANESNMNFISVKGPEIFSQWVGESERTIRKIFNKARQYAPTIIFFDEIDALTYKRGCDGKTGGVEARVLSQLLNEMDGIVLNGDVVVIAATNRPDDLDSAILRSGRLDHLVYIDLPNENARRKIMEINKINVDDELIRLTEGFSGAEIVMYCDTVKMQILREEVISDNKLTDLENFESVCERFKKIMIKAKPRTSQESLMYFKSFQESHGNYIL